MIYTMYALSYCRFQSSCGDLWIMCIGDNRSDRKYADTHDTYFIKARTSITMTIYCRFQSSCGDLWIMCIGDNRSDRKYADTHDTYFIKARTSITMTMNFPLCKAWFTICNCSSVVLITSVP